MGRRLLERELSSKGGGLATTGAAALAVRHVDTNQPVAPKVRTEPVLRAADRSRPTTSHTNCRWRGIAPIPRSARSVGIELGRARLEARRENAQAKVVHRAAPPLREARGRRHAEIRAVAVLDAESAHAVTDAGVVASLVVTRRVKGAAQPGARCRNGVDRLDVCNAGGASLARCPCLCGPACSRIALSRGSRCAPDPRAHRTTSGVERAGATSAASHEHKAEAPDPQSRPSEHRRHVPLTIARNGEACRRDRSTDQGGPWLRPRRRRLSAMCRTP